MNDILNLSFHTRRLIILALNSSKTKAEARRKTGLSERTFFNLLKEYEIFKGKDGYYSDKQIEYKIIKVYEK